MTCHELRVYFDDPLRMDSERPGAVEHLAQCAECARFVEARCELGAGLRLLRRIICRTFCGARGGCSGELPPAGHWPSISRKIEERPIHGSLLDCGGSCNSGSCGRPSFSSRADNGDFARRDGFAAASVRGAAGYLDEDHEQGSLDEHCFLAEIGPAFR